uniref:Valine--tRNA ligase n=1 Tax=Heliothis virescens TaxID=7102 RepID=A0A2A4KB09_HELVI
MIRLQNYKVPLLHIQQRLITSTTNVVLKPSVSANAYQPKNVEKKKYDKWEKDNLFKAENTNEKPKFSMVLPPPNVTGNLHLGHALACTIQDVIVRQKRSQGHNVLWLPGIDHAGIATQGVVERYLQTRQDMTRYDIGREKFIEEVWKWKDKHGNAICNQLRTLGCSLDWSRQAFTMDQKHTHAVNTAFIKLFSKGLIYRKKALVNWCSTLKSTVSDIEVDNVTINGPKDINVPGYKSPIRFGLMYHFAYKVFESDKEIVVATTMPETMLGDTAIAVHPKDERYAHLAGKKVWHPFRNSTIPIIFDDFVDMDVGTGVVKLTPAHSKIDYEVAKDHNIPLLEVIDEQGKMKNSDIFNNMKRYDCRNAVVKALEDMGLMRSTKPHQMTLPVCSRTGGIIDHIPKEQWFLSCSQLNERAAELVETGKLVIEPDKFVKYWLDWTGDDRDWCISRQLWWGHQIPAYKCSVDRDVVWVAAPNEAAAKMQASKFLRTLSDMISVERDSDVLDTWFSSGIYPFAALGWPNGYKNKDYGTFYPLSLLATGHDILGFWVHRMVILGLELTGQLPFNKVLLHGVICDSKGAKMSKSRGNVIDPLDVIDGISLQSLKDKTKEMHRNGALSLAEMDKALAYHQANFTNTKGIPECGVDALRFTLLSHDIKSHYVNFDIAMCHSNKLFGNKIWQSVRYTQLAYMKLPTLDINLTSEDLTYFDKWILSRLAEMVERVNISMDNYDFHLATKAIRTLMYNEFCDIYLEATKPGIEGKDAKMAYAHAHTLSAVLNTSLRCLAPFMVYLTEELIPKVPTFANNIVCNFEDANNKYLDFPRPDDFKRWKDKTFEWQVSKFLGTINLIREIKGLYNISNKLKPSVYIESEDDKLKTDIVKSNTVFLNLSRCSEVEFKKNPNRKHVSAILDEYTKVKVELLGEDLDVAVFAARTKLEKKIQRLEDGLSKLEAKFASGHYLTHAPQWAQVSDKEKLNKKKKEIEELQRLM